MIVRVFTVVLLGVFITGCEAGDQYLDLDGRTRSYALHVPDTLPPDEAVPLLLALHQFTDSGPGLRRLTGFDRLADEEGFIVAYPDGVNSGWNAGRDEEVDDVKFLLALVDRVAGQYPVDQDRIYATGASAGGMMAQYLACRSRRIAAIAPVMGSLPAAVAESCAPEGPVPVLLIHGTADPIIPYDGGDTPSGPGRSTEFLSAEQGAAFWALHNGCGPTASERLLPDVDGDASTRAAELRYACPESGPVVLYRLVGGGHTWPGGHNAYPWFITGPVSPELDASRAIWDFLKQFRNARNETPIAEEGR